MRNRKQIILIGCSAAFLLLILDAKTAADGMREGIELCTYTLLPALFPFSILSILITESVFGSRIMLLTPVCKLCAIPEGSESLFAVGILGGYPVGSQNAAMVYRNGKLNRSDAQRMAVFCNNAGPAFIFGILSSSFENPGALFLLWGIQILSAIFTGILMPGGSSEKKRFDNHSILTISDAIRAAATGMVGICSSVMLFRMILEFLNRWLLWAVPDQVNALIAGILELSNGCILLSVIENQTLRFITASGLLSFGGLCVWLQTLSVCRGLKLNHYLPWKAVQAMIAMLLATAAMGIRKFFSI